MRKIILLFVAVFLNGMQLFAQIPTYTMSTQTVSGICLGAFTDSDVGIGLFSPDSYGNNEDYTMTFCSGSTLPITFIFSLLNITSGDHLMIYDGPNTGSPLLYDISNTNMGNLTITSSGTCITFWFTSDGSGSLFSTNGNWAAGFECGTINPADVAADDCINAPAICDLSGYFGNTSSSYTPDEPGNMCQTCALFDGSLENNSWLKFFADNDTVIFTVSLISCTLDDGIQFGVYQGDNCNNFILMTPLSWTSVNAAPITPGSTATIVATGLVPGQVYYIMIDGYGGDDCQYVIHSQSGMQFGATITPDQSICPGDNALIELGLSGNIPVTWTSIPSDPSLSGQEHNPSITVTPSATTTYSVFIQDSAGFCSVDTTLYTTVTVLPPNDPSCFTVVVCTINKTDATTCPIPPSNTCNGVATVVVTGGSGTYTYLWNNGNTNSVLSNLCAGNYSVTITDSNIPTFVTSCSVTILGPEAPTYTYTTDSSCQNGSNGSIELTINTGVPPYSFLWNNSATTQNLSGIPPGSYSVTITDIGSCSSYANINVYSLPSPPVNFTVSGTGCSPVIAYFQDLTNDNIIHWIWELSDGTTVNDINQFSHIFTTTTQTETYWAKLWVENENGCSAELLINNAVTVYPIPVAIIAANPSVAYLNEPITFEGGTGYNINEWIWNFDYPYGIYEIFSNNTTTHSYSTEGIYSVYLIVKNSGGCSDTAYTQVEIIDIQIPNVFTPNGDGFNDNFEIKNIERLQNTNIKIFNRWGKKIFETDNYMNDWSGNNYADGIYYYIISLGGDNSFEGTITILR